MWEKIKWKDSVFTKLILGFGVVILAVMIAEAAVQSSVTNTAKELTYDKMLNNADYFLNSFKQELEHINSQQEDFLTNRKLSFLSSPGYQLSAYEKYDCIQTVQEHLRTITEGSRLIEQGIICLRETDYWIEPHSVWRLSEDKAQEYQAFLEYQPGKMYFDSKSFILMETEGIWRGEESTCRHLFVLKLSAEAIREMLAGLAGDEKSGAFFAESEGKWFLTEYGKEGFAGKLKKELKKEEDGSFLKTQQVTLAGEKYLVCVLDAGVMGTFVQYTKQKDIMGSIDRATGLMIAVIVFIVGMAAGFVYYMRQLIQRPIANLLSAFKQFETGEWNTEIKHKGKDEFGLLYDGFNRMAVRTKELIEKVYIQTDLAREAQMKQLQAQINPHFLYNSFFILCRRIKKEDYENALDIAEHLGDYFRFLTRNGQNEISLRQEVEHAKSYAAIQRIRFANRIQIQFEELPREYEEMLVPRLILQPLLENAFEYGLAQKAADGLLRISFKRKYNELLLIVEDNGEDLTEERLEKLRTLQSEQREQEITALKNIHLRLKFYFKKDSGLYFERSSLGGLKVTALLELPDAFLERSAE
jgi:integral membrane sensor signal transduction histidine kinase